MHRPFAFVALLLTLSLPGCGGSSADEEFDELEGKRHAVRYFQAALNQRSLLTNELVMDEREIDLFRRTQVFLIESDRVLESALRHADLAEWDAIPEGEETLDWVRERLVVRFRDGSEVLQIALVDRRAPKEAMVAIVEAISKAYLNEVVFESKIQRQKPRDILSASYRDLDEEIGRKTKAYQALLKEASSARLPEIAARIELLKQQIDRLANARIDTEREMLQRLVELKLTEEPTAEVPADEPAGDPMAGDTDDSDSAESDPDESNERQPEEAPADEDSSDETATGEEDTDEPATEDNAATDKPADQPRFDDLFGGDAASPPEAAATDGETPEADSEAAPAEPDPFAQLPFAYQTANPSAKQVASVYIEYLQSLDKRIEELSQQVEDLSRDDPDLAARAAELEGLKAVQAEISEKIEHWDIELKMPNRITEFGSVEFHEP